MDPIGSFSGLASGIQWRDLVDQIMKVETSRQLSPVEARVAKEKSRKSAWTSFNGLVTKFSDAAKQLRDGSAFRAFQTSVGKTPAGQTLFSASTSSTAAPGNYKVEVVQLARSEKLNGSTVASTTDALGKSGEFWVNGKRVELAATDNLTSLRDKINAVNAGAQPSGVTATILSTGVDSHRLILSADNTGSRGIELVDGSGSGNALAQLGILDGTTARNTSLSDPTRAESLRIGSKTSYLATALGISTPPLQTTVSFGGVKVDVDLSTDSLTTVMNRINAKGGQASIVEETVGGKTMHRLQVNGQVDADASLDAAGQARSQRVVELLGFVRAGRTAEISAGQDAKVRIDGFTLTRRTNTVSDAISGVTLDLTAANGAERTASVSGSGLSMLKDPRTIDAGSYDIQLQASGTAAQSVTTSTAELTVGTAPGGLPQGTYAVELSSTTTRSTSTSTASLQVASAPSTVSAGSYDVVITEAATKTAVTGTANSTYSGSTGDYFQIVDNTTGITGKYSLTSGQTLDSVVLGLNNMFSSSGMKMTASNDGGKLKLESSDYGNKSFTVATSHNQVASNYGIGSTSGVTYSGGKDVAGTIGGLSATGVGQMLTGSTGAVNGLQVKYTGSTTGSPVGSVTVTDSTVTTATIGGQAATWDSGTKTVTANAGTSLAGLSLSYSGALTSGKLGDVTVSMSPDSIAGVTLGGEAAVWDPSTLTIRGARGSRFEGVEIKYTGTATSGSIGKLEVTGNIASDLTVTRDLDSTVGSVQKLAAAYNDVVKFVDSQSKNGSPLYASGALRSILSSVKGVLLADVQAIDPASTPYVRPGIAGVALSKTGMLEVDAAKLKSALTTNLADVQRLFATAGTGSTTDLSYVGGTDKTQPGTYAVNITQAASRAAYTGSALASGFTYTAVDATNGDTLSITDALTGIAKDYVVKDGTGMDAVVADLNSLFENEGMKLSATKVVDGGGNVSLQITSKEYGSAGGFTLSGTATSGLGLGAGPITQNGLDVQGTFSVGADSYAATGKGQSLTGSAGSPAEGLALLYRGTSTGNVGSMNYVLGVAGALARGVDPFIRAGDGTIALQNQALDRSVESLDRRIDSIQARLDLRRESLLKQFSRMEEAIGKYNSQSSWLSGQIRSLQPRQA